jgi:hypothetical protein
MGCGLLGSGSMLLSHQPWLPVYAYRTVRCADLIQRTLFFASLVECTCIIQCAAFLFTWKQRVVCSQWVFDKLFRICSVQ